MFSRIQTRLSFANVTSVIALFFAVGGTSAYAINEWTGANIQDETLTGADVKGVNGTQTVKGTNGSLTGADISGQPAITAVGQKAVDGSINTYDIKDGWLRGVDLQANTLTGAQVDESKLDLGGFFAAASATGECNADSTDVAATCASQVVTTERPGRLLLNATAQWHTFSF